MFNILTGDVLKQLATVPDESVQCVVTSPPYWGLRDYGVAGMIGLEPTLAEHLARIVAVFREVRRVLRDDGTVWLNYGDAYSRQGGDTTTQAMNGDKDTHRLAIKASRGSGGLAPKQRLMLPARVALALQDDGWWIRSEIVWAKGVSFCPTYSGSCMPSSVRDRPTDSHEMMYLLTKRARYFYDGDAVREASDCEPGVPRKFGKAGNDDRNDTGDVYDPTGRSGRNLRTVWTINPRGYKEAHFATFPEALVKPCILAGTSERGACSECGAPWVRVADRAFTGCNSGKRPDQPHASGTLARPPMSGRQMAKWRAEHPTRYLGWEPTCAHTDAPTVPCVVLDPFNGSGTTGAVAVRYGRDYVGIELNPEYVKLSEKRIGRAAAASGQGGSLTLDEDEKSSQFGLFPNSAGPVDAGKGPA